MKPWASCTLGSTRQTELYLQFSLFFDLTFNYLYSRHLTNSLGCSGGGEEGVAQGMVWIGLVRAMGLSCTLASGHWLGWNMVIFKAIINHYNYIADAEMAQGIQKSFQTLRAEVMGVSCIPEHLARSKKAKMNKASYLNTSAGCSGHVVVLVVGQRSFNWEPCFGSGCVVLKIERCSSFIHTLGFYERHFRDLDTDSTPLKGPPPHSVSVSCLCWVRWNSSGHSEPSH